jgi:hypothetical protein
MTSLIVSGQAATYRHESPCPEARQFYCPISLLMSVLKYRNLPYKDQMHWDLF